MLFGVCKTDIRTTYKERGKKMEGKKKECLWAILISLVGCVYILYQTLGVSVTEKTIIDFLVTTMVVPAVVLIISGVLLGRKNKLMQSLPCLLLVSVLVFGASIFSTAYCYNTEAVFEMLKNTQTANNVVLEINESITFGTVVQQALVCLVCACIGNGIGNKTVGVLKAIRN